MRLAESSAYVVLLVVLLACSVVQWLGVDVVKSVWYGEIVIESDGSVYPSDAPVVRVGDVYYLTDDVEVYVASYSVTAIRVERDNVVIDGNGFTLRCYKIGWYSWRHICTGVDISGRYNATVRNLVVETYDYAVYVYSSSYVVVENMTFVGIERSSVFVEYSNNVVVRSNIFRDRGDGIVIRSSSAVEVSNNVYDSIDVFTYAYYSQNISVYGNNVTTYGDAIYVFGVVDLTVYSNYFYGSYGAVLVIGSDNVNIADNVVRAVMDYGIYVHDVGGEVTISGNRVSGASTGCITLSYTSNAVVSGNVVYNCSVGLYVDEASNSVFRLNEVINNEYGMKITSSCCHVCNMSNIVYENVFANNSYGLLIAIYFDVACGFNKFYHNDFINNSVQVLHDWDCGEVSCVPSVNYWDDGYPSGGNFWSDYSGSDMYMGVNQDILGEDGIGDTPYVIDEYNVDRYPLMAPYVFKPPPITTATVTKPYVHTIAVPVYITALPSEIEVPAPTMYAPSLERPESIISFGTLFVMFVYLSRRARWTQALFVTSTVLTVMSMVLYGSSLLFTFGLLLAIVSLVLDKHLS